MGQDPLGPPPRCASEKSLKSKKSFVAKKQPPEVEAEACIFSNKETLAQVFSCEFSEILPENLWVAASGSWWSFLSQQYFHLKNLFVISCY